MQVELGHSIGAAVLPHLQVLPVEVLILASQLQVLLFCRIHLEATYLGWQVDHNHKSVGCLSY